MTDPKFEETGYLMIVQHGRAELFEALRDRLEPSEQVQVVWDRRMADRRRTSDPASTERRRSDRRETNLLGSLVAFLLAESPPKAGSNGASAA